MADYRKGAHTVYDIQYHFVWVTKYRYHVLTGEVATRARELIRQTCMSRNIRILKGHVSKDHVHMHIEYGPNKSISNLVKKYKGRSSRKLQMEYPKLKKRYWGKHFWAIGYGCWSSGNVTEEMINDYLEHHRNPSNKDNGDNFILE